MPDINEVFPSKYLSAEDIGENKPIVTIEKVEMITFKQDGKEEQKPVLFFVGKDKAFTCNKTNAKTIAKVLGQTNTDDWIGRRIRLLATEIDYRGEMKMAIRVSSQPVPQAATTAQPSKTQPAAVAELENDDIPF